MVCYFVVVDLNLSIYQLQLRVPAKAFDLEHETSSASKAFKNKQTIEHRGIGIMPSLNCCCFLCIKMFFLGKSVFVKKLGHQQSGFAYLEPKLRISVICPLG